MRIAIVDDEPLARSRLRALLAPLTTMEVVGEAATGHEALALCAAHTVDVMLLDIHMPGMDGIETARHLARLPAPPAVVFTTAYDEHALAAFEAGAIDYLMKPVRVERLQAALTRAAQWTSARAAQAAQALPRRARSHFSALVAGSLRLVPVAEVRYLRADSGYVSVYHPGGELVIEDALRALEEEFQPDFMRIHRHTLVAVAHVNALTRDRLGNTGVCLTGVPTPLPVSRRLVGDVKRRLRQGLPGSGQIPVAGL